MISRDFTNKTIYGIKSDTARYFWAGYFILVLVSSFVGDTAILIASIRYKAFNLHKLIVVIIQHIAACDLIVSSASVFPRIVSLIADDLILGTPLCHFCPPLAYYSVTVGVFLICSMTSCKLLILKYPFRVQQLSVKHAHIGCTAIWIAVVSLPATMLLLDVDKDGAKFSYRIYKCDYFFSTPHWVWLQPILASICLFIPNVLVILNTVFLLIVAQKIAHRGHKSLKWRGVTTTVLVALVYCISILPYSIHRFAASSVGKQHGWFHYEFVRVAEFVLYLNTLSNFYIYCLTVSSFRKFLWSRIQMMLPCMPARGDGASTQDRPNILTARRQR